MASQDPDSGRYSLLDVISNNGSSSEMVSRLVYVARLAPQADVKKGMSNYYMNLFNTLKVGEDGVTGLLLSFQKHAVHLIECSPKLIMSVMNDLRNHMAGKKPLISEAKVLLHISDVPSRMFPLWSSRALTSASSGDPVESEMLTDIASQLVENLIKIGLHVRGQEKSEIKGVLDTMGEKMPELLPTSEELELLLRAPQFNNADQFCHFMDSPVEVVLDRELVHPIPQRLFPYE